MIGIILFVIGIAVFTIHQITNNIVPNLLNVSLFVITTFLLLASGVFLRRE